MADKLITNKFKTHVVQDFIETVKTPDATFYMFVGDHISGNATVIPNNSIQSTTIESFNNMIFSKQITNSDVAVMATRTNWVGDTVYTEYDHTDGDLDTKNYYVVVNESSFFHVYKCLSNSNGASSTIQPTFSDTSADDTYYETSDGYQWKYMYSVASATFNNFATTEFMPVFENANVTGNAVAGAIDTIKVTSSGSRYDNYFAGVFSTNDIKVSSTADYLSGYSSEVLYSLGDFRSTSNIAGTVAASSGGSNVTGTSTTFVADVESGDYVKVINASNTEQFEIKRVSSVTNNTLLKVAGTFSNAFSSAKLQVTFPFAASPNNSFYTSTWLTLTAGTGAGQYKEIIDYYNDGGKKIAVLASAFATDPSSNTQYEVSPRVIITGDGLQTLNADARAIISSATSNGVARIEILNRGAGYNFAQANISVSNVVSSTVAAVLKPMIGPPGGHGKDAFHELAATRLGISVTFANSEANVITTQNDYSAIGIIKDPLMANVELTIKKPSTGANGSDGSFTLDEKVHQFTGVKLAGSFIVNTTSNTVTSNTTFGVDSDLQESLAIGDNVILKSNNSWQLANVVGVSSSNTMTVKYGTGNSLFSSNSTIVYKAKLTTTSYVKTIEPTFLYVANVVGQFTQNRKMIGTVSGAIANISNIEINNFAKNSGFNVLSQLTYYSGTFVSGAFSNDEILYQTIAGANTATARYHSTSTIDGTIYVYITNQIGSFDTDYNINGAESAAVFNIVTKYDGDLLKNTGEVIYIQHGDAVSRTNTQSEIIKLIVEF
jgi:hypothetical protein